MGKRIIVSVISDLVTDQRVQKECNTLHKMGYEVLLIGRKSNNNFGLDKLPYRTIRFPNPFRRGPLMYLYFNKRLFFFLLFNKADILWSNDLDTLLPNFLIARLKGRKLIYDSHEYFTMSVYKPFSRKIWHALERYIFPKLKNVITVNESIKDVYEKEYGVPVTILRNVPYKNDITYGEKPEIPKGKKILIIQGMGINEHRGAEEAVEMMQYLPDEFILYFIGKGTVIDKLRQMVKSLKLEKKVVFIGVLPYLEVMGYTRQSFLGLIFEKIDFTDEHNFALPNRFFDYIKAGIPVLSSKGVELKSVIDKYDIGGFVDKVEPVHLAERVKEIAGNEDIYSKWKQNTLMAREELCWEKEEEKLIKFMERI